MLKRSVFVLVLSVNLTSYANSIGTITENFDVDPNWAISGNGIGTNDFGYDAVNGRVGGRFTRTGAIRFIGDNDIGEISPNEPFSASGTFILEGAFIPDFIQGLEVGFFITNPQRMNDRVGFGFGHGGDKVNNVANEAIYQLQPLAAAEKGAGAETVINMPLTVDFSFVWDPTTNILSGTFGNHVLSKQLESNQITTYDAFGIHNADQGNSIQSLYLDIFIDNVVYTPEPSSFILLAI